MSESEFIADESAEAACPRCHHPTTEGDRYCGACGCPLQIDDTFIGVEKGDPLIGKLVADRYRIVALLGRGGMGVVYKVEHIHIGKWMAMKLLHGELARDRRVVERFRREAEMVSRLSHPNTVQVFDFGNSDGMMYLVMELLEGQDLGQVLRAAGAIDFVRTARIGAQICASVAEAHQAGVVHRDLKPGNIMILPPRDDGFETAKVLDFGLAKIRENPHEFQPSVTRAGAIMGTPHYMSPEQIRGEDVDARGDVYSIGALLYRACAGVPPFASKTPMGVLTKHLTEKLVPPGHHRELPPEADAILTKALAKAPEDRFQTAADLRRALVDFLESIGEVPKETSRAFSFASVAKLSRLSLATRRDVDAFEQKLRRRGTFQTLLTLIGFVSVVFGIYWASTHWLATFTSRDGFEHEPNGTPSTAATLRENVAVQAQLGRRTDDSVGDVDIWILRNNGSATRYVDVRVSSLPNVDMVFDVFRSGSADPILTVDSGGRATPESLTHYPLAPGDYLLRVRERWMRGTWPTENVSDDYTIEYRFVSPPDNLEREPNDRTEHAETLRVGSHVQGFLGWPGDLDTFCLPSEASAPVKLRVTGVSRVNLVLQKRLGSETTSIDVADIGEGEEARVEPGACVSLAARESPTPSGLPWRSNGVQSWVLTAVED